MTPTPHVNPLKQALAEGRTLIGTTVTIPSAEVAASLAASQLDFLWIEMEHSPITLETAREMILATRGLKAVPITRVPVNERELLAHVADALFNLIGVTRHVDPEHGRFTRRRLEETAQDSDRGRLTGAVRAEKTENFARLDLKAHAVDRNELREALGELFHLDGGPHREALRPAARSRRARAIRTAATASVFSSPARKSPTSASMSSEDGVSPAR